MFFYNREDYPIFLIQELLKGIEYNFHNHNSYFIYYISYYIFILKEFSLCFVILVPTMRSHAQNPVFPFPHILNAPLLLMYQESQLITSTWFATITVYQSFILCPLQTMPQHPVLITDTANHTSLSFQVMQQVAPLALPVPLHAILVANSYVCKKANNLLCYCLYFISSSIIKLHSAMRNAIFYLY